jgi:Tol biopolymer transport system component
MSRDLRSSFQRILAATLVTLLGTAAAAGAAGGAPFPRLAYVTEGSKSASTVWSSNLDGSAPQRLGLGSGPLLSPDGLTVAASLFGSLAGVASGPEVALYSTVGAPARTYLSLKDATAQPLGWSPDSRYLAIDVESGAPRNVAAHSALDVLDTSTGTITTVAHGQIYGASFAQDGSDRLAYARAGSLSVSAAVNVFTTMPDGSGSVQLTGDGRSLNPVWGSRYLAYDRERLRRNSAPVFQVWLRVMRPGGALRRITGLRVSPLVSGLVPIAFSPDGTRLLAEFEGEDTSEAWVLRTSGSAPRRLTSHGQSVLAAGISADGNTVLIDEGSFEQQPSSGRIATTPFGGGAATVLVTHGAQASWNG